MAGTKLGRWLGWAQCAVVAANVGLSLDDMKAINQRCMTERAEQNAPATDEVL
ncbi:hypothetical protein [Mycolicibacterium tusciae]|uniref:hypothetical protein n=1 Tax=Mycolicibacterium tusciae TaxID=75922 RepID=UPI0002EE40EB|nr:hypothetical protein [Mycolicibacterium tusciae]